MYMDKEIHFKTYGYDNICRDIKVEYMNRY